MRVGGLAFLARPSGHIRTGDAYQFANFTE